MTGMALSLQDQERVAQSPGWRERRVEVMDTAGGKVVVKGQRAPRHPARYRILNALAGLLRAPLLKAAPMHGGARAQAVELARLRALHQAGARVPEVLHAAPDHIVMRWLGDEHLGILLQNHHPHALALWKAAAAELLALHRAGQYLSQGFARNMIVDTHAQPPRLAGWIDFEDDPLEVMGLPQAQARDWLAFLHSTLWTLPLDSAAIDAWLRQTMDEEQAAVRAEFLRAGRQLGRLRYVPSSRRFGRDTVALQAVAAAVHRYAEGPNRYD